MNKKQLPKNCTIMGYDFDIIYVRDKDAVCDAGSFNAADKKIFINTDFNDSYKTVLYTIDHEVFECLLTLLNFRYCPLDSRSGEHFSFFHRDIDVILGNYNSAIKSLN